MFWKPIESQDPLILSAKAIAWRDPTGSGNKKDRKWLLLPVGVIAAGLVAAAILLPKPPDTSKYREQLAEDFVGKGINVYSEIKIHPSSGPYAGYTYADDTRLWFIGSGPEYPGGDSYDRDDAVWSGFYEDTELLGQIASGISEDTTVLTSTSGFKNVTIGIDSNPDRRIYLGEHVLICYEGGDPEVYTVLEKLFGEPIADGRW